ncbi:MAG: hypothetical protein L0215_14925 [Gemmataceae bacterium]|nr:hypothetical protein [Gemmataceae bacterium]
MTALVRCFACAVLFAVAALFLRSAQAMPNADSYWQVDDVRAGMKGTGRTVIKGTKIESFDAEVIGVLKNVNPGRDMILCRLSGLNLDKTGVIAGMSGSPIYIQNKLLGAVAFAWPFGKEPIAGVTPFSQMHEFVASYERRDLAEKGKPRRIGLAQPLRVGGKTFDTVTVQHDYADPQPTAADGLWLTPLRTPLAVTGFSPNSMALLRDSLSDFGMTPMQGGGVPAKISDEERNTPIAPGGALMVSMVTGDFDMSGIGTVTHVEGKRVYGWGHPFFNIGACEFPLMTGYVHLIMPRLTMSVKMGSTIKTVGVINADVSTCIAGWLDRQPDMLPVSATLLRETGGQPKTYNVQMARFRPMMPGLLQTILVNSVDMEGDLPEEMTAQLKLRIHLDGRDPIVLDDTYAGTTISANRAPQALFNQVGLLMTQLNVNPFANLRINKIECTTEIFPGRRTAEIDSVEIETDTYAPGETVKANVYLRCYKSGRQRVPVSLTLPDDLSDGNYTITVSDDLANARAALRDNPALGFPQTLEQLFQSLQVITAAKRTHLALRLPLQGNGVALGGKTLPDLPGSMVQILAGGRRTGVQQTQSAVVARFPTEWVVAGQDVLRFSVKKNKAVN